MHNQYDIIHIPGKILNAADYLYLVKIVLIIINKYLSPIQQQEKDLVLKRWKEEVSGKQRRKSDNNNDLSISNGLLQKGNHEEVNQKDLQNEVLEQLNTNVKKGKSVCLVAWD